MQGLGQLSPHPWLREEGVSWPAGSLTCLPCQFLRHTRHGFPKQVGSDFTNKRGNFQERALLEHPGSGRHWAGLQRAHRGSQSPGLGLAPREAEGALRVGLTLVHTLKMQQA